jgi:predicted MFS family arabinose efflux permease
MHFAHNTCAASSFRRGDHPYRASDAAFRTVVIGLIGFLTLVDLFATQAILPTLARHYNVAPSAMGVAVNASTIGMAIAGLAVALFSRKIDRRAGIWASLALLAIPTALLANAGSLEVFTVLRIVQGLFMAAAFTLTMAYLAEHCTAEAAAGALASYVTGGVASNLIGRLVAGLATDALGISTNFHIFALLNLAGAVLVFFSLKRATPMEAAEPRALSPLASWALHLRNRSLRACFAIGFLILFSFISTFTYVNFVLVREPIGLSPMELGLVYLVFLPSMITTPLAGRFARVAGAKVTFLAALGVACLGLPLLIIPNLFAVLLGLVLVGIGTFFAQATATGFVGRAAMSDRAAASGLYLASYYFGGLAGAAVIGAIFDRFGWTASVFGIFMALALAAFLARGLRAETAPAMRISVSQSPHAGADHAQPV